MPRYQLRYDDGRPPEFIDADGPTEAVNQRAGGLTTRMPCGITDMGLLSRMATGSPHSTPLRDMLYGVEDSPIRRKELA